MSYRRKTGRGRDVHGILLLDKPLGITSNDALQKVKRLFGANKAGHTGSLDPLADGLLPICFGNATKLSAYLLDADKRYWMRARLGVTTVTQDAEGDVAEVRSVEGVTEAGLQSVLEGFRGEIQQIPPMYSALKHQGQRLYKLAREGIEVERQPRTVQIYELNLVNFELPDYELDIRCSKGTYVRTLAADVGERLGCGAHVTALRRSGVGPYGPEHMVTLARLEEMVREGEDVDALLLSVDSALGNWPEVRLSPDAAFYLRQGQAVLSPGAPLEGLVRLYDPNGRFLGVGEMLDDRRVAPRRLM